MNSVQQLVRALLILATWCLMAGNVQAEHEIDHRYNIRGYVLDSAEKAKIGEEVQVFAADKLLARGNTDSAGYYSLQLHLHNKDNHRVLRLRTGSDEAELRVEFDPADLTTQRVHDANFVGGAYVEGSLIRFRIPPWVYALAALALIGFILVMLERRRKKRLRQSSAASGSGAPRAQKAKKRRRKKH